MEKIYAGEKWKSLVFDFEFVNETRIEISNFGRVKTFNRVFKGNILKGSTINGYNIIRLKFFKPRDARAQAAIELLQDQVAQTTKHLQELKTVLSATNPEEPKALALKGTYLEEKQVLKQHKDTLRVRVLEDLKQRTINYHSLIHRLVAEYFIPRPSPNHTVVAHIDYDKTNNRSSNLQWMTPEENYQHQRFSPNAIASKTHLEGRRKEEARSTKLTVTKVMLLKKLMNEGKPMKQLVKQFKITETQILRIKKGINWSEIPAAPSS